MKGYTISLVSILSILLVLLSCIGLVYADRFVSVDAAADGDGSFEKPWRFADALQQVLPDGEPILVNGSSSTAYSGPMNIGNRSIFIGYNGTPKVSASGYVFIISNSSTLQNFEIDNSAGASNGIALSSGVSGVNLSRVTIQRMMNAGIFSSGSLYNYYTDLTISNSRINKNQGTGIFLNHLSPLKIDNVTCSQNQLGGLFFKNISNFKFNSLISEGNTGNRAGCTLNDSYAGTFDNIIISGNAEGGFSLYNSSFITINSSIFRDHSTGFDFFIDTSSHDIHLNNIQIGGDTGANVTAVNMSKGFGFTTPASIPPSPSYNTSLGVYVDVITGADSSFDQLSLQYDEVPTGYPEDNIRIMKNSDSHWVDVPSHVDLVNKYVSFNESGSISPGISTYGVFVRHSPPSIHYISPNVTYLDQNVLFVDVFGSSFNVNPVVEIGNETYFQINSSPILFVNESYLNASFQVGNFVSGLYTLKVTNPDLQESNLIPFTFTVPCPSVSASFTSNLSSGTAPLAVLFTDSSTGGNLTIRSWNFGDGSLNQTGSNVIHTFAQAGNYSVTLFALNDCGNVGVKTGNIQVLAPAPVCPSVSASFTSNLSSGVAPLTVSFTDSSTGGNLTTRSWNFGDGSVNQTGSNVIHTFAQPGNYSVTLFALNDCGNVGMRTETIHVFAPAPVCPSVNSSFTSNLSSGLTPLTVSFTDSSTGGNLTTRSWNFGDGSLNQSGSSVVHTFAQAGNYSVTLFALNDCGKYGAFSNLVHVFPPQPVPGTHIINATSGLGGKITPSGLVPVIEGSNHSFVIEPTAGFTIGSVTVDGVQVGPLSSYTFGNVSEGHTIYATFNPVSAPPDKVTIIADADIGSAIDPSGPVYVREGGSQSFRIWAKTGYTVQDVLVNGISVGNPTTYQFSDIRTSQTISVRSSLIPGALQPDFTTNITAGPAPLSVLFSDATVGAPTQYFWRFGDGSFSTEKNPMHLYTKQGTYTVSLTVKNSYGSSITTKNIYISVTDQQYTILSQAGAGGSIIPNGSFSAYAGSDQTFMITPSPGYRIEDLEVNGQSVGPVASYTLSHISADHRLNVRFVSLTPSPVITGITPGTGDQGSVLPLLTINGRFFTGGERIDLVRPGSVNISGIGNLSSGSLLVHHLDLRTATPGTYDVWVIGNGTGSSVLKEAFTITNPPVPVPVPQITGMSPSVAYQNTTVPRIEITGSNFSQSCRIDLTMPGAPSISGTGRLSGVNSLILDNLDLHGAPTGIRNLTVTDIGTKNSGTLPNAMNVLIQPQVPAPSISDISPQEADRNTVIPGLMIQGTGMYGGEDVRLVKGSHSMNVTGVAIQGGIMVQNLSLMDASPGLYSIHVTNLTTGLTGSLIHGFKVSGSELFTITAGSNQYALVNPVGNHTISAGGSKNFVIKPSAGCRLVNITVDGALVEADPTGRYTFTNVDQDHILYATGEPLSGVIIAGFTANVTEGSSPFTVQFSDTSSGSPKQWFWTFGDGSSSQLQNPVHMYTRAGTYTVKLWVRNDRSSGTSTKKQMITVSDGNTSSSITPLADVSSGAGLPAVVSMPEGSPLSSVSPPVSAVVFSSPLVPPVAIR